MKVKYGVALSKKVLSQKDYFQLYQFHTKQMRFNYVLSEIQIK